MDQAGEPFQYVFSWAVQVLWVQEIIDLLMCGELQLSSVDDREDKVALRVQDPRGASVIFECVGNSQHCKPESMDKSQQTKLN